MTGFAPESCGDADEQAFTDIHGPQPMRQHHRDDRPMVTVAISIDEYQEDEKKKETR